MLSVTELQRSKVYDARLRFQVPNNHLLTQNQYYNSYYPNLKYLVIGYMMVHGPSG